MMALCPAAALSAPCSVSGRFAKPASSLRPAFRGSRAPLLTSSKRLQQQRGQLTLRAYLRQFPDPEFIAETKEAFPDKGVATIEEARVLLDAGYKWLDVRTALEYDEMGRVKGSINVPFMNAKKVYDPEQGKKVVQKEENTEWLAQVEKKFPNKDTPILVACSDSRTYTMDCLVALDEAGYTNLVGVKGGFYSWYRVFDFNLRRRMTGEYAEQYTHDGDSCGIHSSGAGFARVDKIEQWVPPTY